MSKKKILLPKIGRKQIVGFSYPLCKLLHAHLKQLDTVDPINPNHTKVFKSGRRDEGCILKPELIPVVKFLAGQVRVSVTVCDQIEEATFGWIEGGQYTITELINIGEKFLAILEKDLED